MRQTGGEQDRHVIEQSSYVIDGYWLPQGVVVEVEEEVFRYEDGGQQLIIQRPQLSADYLKQLAAYVQQRRQEVLIRRNVEQIVDVIDRTIAQWLEPSYPLRLLAERWIPVITGYDAEMVRLELKRYLRLFRRKELERFLQEELDPPALLDRFCPRRHGGMSRAYGAPLLFHLFSGNVPGLPIWSLVMGLLVKSASIGKVSSGEPLMAVLFARSLAECDAELADCMAILPWKGGDQQLELPLLEAAETTIVYGSINTVESVRGRLPMGRKLLSYGHKISFAMVGREALTADRYRDTARRLAEDVSVYDQMSCMSPQTIFVEHGGVISPELFAQLVAGELVNYASKRQRAVLTESEALGIHTMRQEAELRQLSGEAVRVFHSGDTQWTVVYEEKPSLGATPLNRCVRVCACDDLGDIPPRLHRYRTFIQSVGLACAPWRLEQIADHLGEAGITRICAIGTMSRAQAGWHHDGRFNVLDLLRFVDLERSVEEQAERYDPDVE